MQQKALTVVFGTYMNPELIIPTLDGLRDQTFKDFEVYVVDDNPPTESEYIERAKEIISNYDDLSIHYIKNDINLGVPHVFRLWVSLVKTRYFYICGAGDRLLPHAFGLMVNFLDQNPKSSMVHALESFEDEQGGVVKNKELFSSTRNVASALYLESHLIGGNPRLGWSQCSAVFRTQFFNIKNVRVTPYHYWDHYFHMVYLLYSDQIGYINDFVTVRNVDNGLIDWANNNVLINRIETLYQALKFIDEFEINLINRKLPVNKYRLIIIFKLLKQSLKLKRTDEILLCLNEVFKNSFKLLLLFASLIFFFPLKLIASPFVRKK